MSAAARSVALVHDYFTQRGGAERVAERLAALFPGAPLYTSVFDHDVLPESIPVDRVRTTGLQRLREAGTPLKALAPFLPAAFGRLDLGTPDVVLSSTSAFAQHVQPWPGAAHICYCHTPPPFLWRPRDYFAGRAVRRWLAAPVLSAYRARDRAVGREIDVFVANSRFTAARIAQSYGRDAHVVHPPIDVDGFAPSSERSGRFLVVARLRPHKGLDLAIAAANEQSLPLDVIGEGSDRARLQARAGPTIAFLGRCSDAEVAAAMARCTALLVPGIEDFGMATAEVQAAGRPPIAFAGGGAPEIVRDGETGFLVTERTAAAIGAAMQRARREDLDSCALVASARRFDRSVFDASIRELVGVDVGVVDARTGDDRIVP